jgi:hypothetical protein
MDQTSPQSQPHAAQIEVSNKTDSSPATNGNQDTSKPEVPATVNGHDEANEDINQDVISDKDGGDDEQVTDIQTDAPKKKKKKRKPKSKRGLVSPTNLFKRRLTHLSTPQLAWKSSSPTPP